MLAVVGGERHRRTWCSALCAKQQRPRCDFAHGRGTPTTSAAIEGPHPNFSVPAIEPLPERKRARTPGLFPYRARWTSAPAAFRGVPSRPAPTCRPGDPACWRLTAWKGGHTAPSGNAFPFVHVHLQPNRPSRLPTPGRIQSTLQYGVESGILAPWMSIESISELVNS